MAFIDWDDSLSVGVAEIDEQHKHEADIINRMHESHGEEEIKLFRELVEHTKFHFATEEKYFDQFGYEGAAPHKAAHKALLDLAAKLEKKVEEGTDLTEDEFLVIKRWLVDHIKNMDQKYTGCFQQHGLK